MKSESEVAQSCLLLATPWTAAYQAPLSMGFSKQEYWSRVPLPKRVILDYKLLKDEVYIVITTAPHTIFLCNNHSVSNELLN